MLRFIAASSRTTHQLRAWSWQRSGSSRRSPPRRSRPHPRRPRAGLAAAFEAEYQSKKVAGHELVLRLHDGSDQPTFVDARLQCDAPYLRDLTMEAAQVERTLTDKVALACVTVTISDTESHSVVVGVDRSRHVRLRDDHPGPARPAAHRQSACAGPLLRRRETAGRSSPAQEEAVNLVGCPALHPATAEGAGPGACCSLEHRRRRPSTKFRQKFRHVRPQLPKPAHSSHRSHRAQHFATHAKTPGFREKPGV
jgi:hypothetical protein